MCGRYSEPRHPIKAYRDYGLEVDDNYQPSADVRPGSLKPIITKNSPLQLKQAKWGLIPSWSETFKSTFSTFNARAETLMTSKLYKDPFLHHRCLILASEFFEWVPAKDGSKTKYSISAKDREYFSFAGLYDIWTDAEEKPFYSYTIITTEPSLKFSTVHNREAVILHHDDEMKWVDESTPIDDLNRLLAPYPSELTEIHPTFG